MSIERKKRSRVWNWCLSAVGMLAVLASYETAHYSTASYALVSTKCVCTTVCDSLLEPIYFSMHRGFCWAGRPGGTYADDPPPHQAQIPRKLSLEESRFCG